MNTHINKIWKEYHNQLLAFINTRVHDNAIAEDILQDVFVKTLHKIDELKDEQKLKSWLFSITRNAITDYFRKKKKESSIVGYEDSDDEFEQENAMKKAEGWIGIYIDELPDNYRKPIELYELQNKSIQEIADELGITYTNARARIQRGRKALKKSLTDCCTFHVDVYGNVIDYYPNPPKCDGC
ncbi:RNA polymerase sigma factor SigZ [Sunxiuqinia sp. A32]|uniref:RNA polymerase sigma factor SigZ n=1 Tax=Sunxiuqinia sp. A32 TaxID=3461496 RepID=UPI0040460808